MQLKKSVLVLLLIVFSLLKTAAQTFTSNATAQFQNSTIGALSNSITVSGLSNSLDGVNLGLSQISFTLTTTEYKQLEVFLVAPNGRIIQLVDGNNNSTSNNVTAGVFTFNMQASSQIRDWLNNGTLASSYLPNVTLNALNDGQDPNGSWKIYARSVAIFSSPKTTITNWSITFGSTNIAPAPGSNNSCSDAIPIPNFTKTGAYIQGDNTGYGANLAEAGAMGSSCYTFSSKKQTVTTAWYTFVPKCSDDIIRIHAIGNSYTSIVKDPCTSTTFNSLACKKVGVGTTFDYTYSYSPGETYFLIVDGDNSITDRFSIWWIPGSCYKSPVDLLSFSGFYNKNINQISLNWQTAWEYNNKGFQIEYRKHGEVKFQDAGFVESANYSQGHKYTFNLPISEEGAYEIKLTQEDNDGTSETFDPILIYAIPEVLDPLKILYQNTNPEGRVYLTKDQEITYSIFSVNGSLVYEAAINGQEGWNAIELPVKSSGVYFLKVLTEDFFRTAKFVKE